MNQKTKKFDNLFSKDSKWASLIIIIGLILLYILFYPTLTNLVGADAVYWVVIPVIIIGWLHGIRASLIASVVSMALSMILTYNGQNDRDIWMGHYLWGGFLLTATSFTVEYLRNKVKNYAQIASKLNAREKYLAVLTEMTQTILAGQYFDYALHTLVETVTQLFQADDCYITHWDEVQERITLVVTSTKLEQPYSAILTAPGEKNMSTSALEAGRVLFANDVRNSPYINPDATGLFSIHSMLGIPLIVNQHKLGAIIITFNKPHTLNREETALAEQTGTQIALALWNVQQEKKNWAKVKRNRYAGQNWPRFKQNRTHWHKHSLAADR